MVAPFYGMQTTNVQAEIQKTLRVEFKKFAFCPKEPQTMNWKFFFKTPMKFWPRLQTTPKPNCTSKWTKYTATPE